MKRNIFIRIISMVLSLLMAASVLPFSVWAQNVEDPAGEVAPIVEPIEPVYEEDIPENSSSVITDEPRGDNIIDNVPVGETFYTQEGLALRLNVKGDSFSVVDFINPAATSVNIPTTYSGLPVTRIADSAFKDMTNLVTVILHDGIQYVGDDVFGGCTALQFNVLDGVNYIGTATNPYFYAHSAESNTITEYAAPAETRIIASYAFYNCNNLKVANFHKDIIQVGFRCLRGCDSIEEVTLPFAGEVVDGDTNSHVGFAFGARTYGGNISFVPLTLTKLHVLGGSLQKNALFGLDGITHLTLPRMTAHLGYYYGAETYEENINYIPATLTSVTVTAGDIPDYAFYECIKLTEVSLPHNAKIIGEGILYGCYSLIKVTVPFIGAVNGDAFNTEFAYFFSSGGITCPVPDSIKTIVLTNAAFIGVSAFSNLLYVENIVIPDTVTYIGIEAFTHCLNLKGIIIPDSVLSIGASAFYRCTNLETLIIGNSVESIGYGAFQYCQNISSVTIPGSVVEIGSDSFVACTNLLSVNILEGVEIIGENAFYGCELLETLFIPNSVSTIKTYAIYDCSNLKYIIYNGTYDEWNGIEKSKYLWNRWNPGDFKIYCSDATVSQDGTVDYLSIDNGYSLDLLSLNNDVSYVDESLFDIAENTESSLADPFVVVSLVTMVESLPETTCSYQNLPAPLDDIASLPQNEIFNDSSVSYSSSINGDISKLILVDNFNYSEGLQYAVLSNGKAYVTGIGTCKDTDIILPSTNPDGNEVIGIGWYAFANNTNITSIIIPDSVTWIDQGAFYGCTALNNIIIPNSVTSIGASSFVNCKSLTSITLPFIGTYAGGKDISFQSLFESSVPESLKTVIITEQTNIPGGAFRDCSNITEIIINNLSGSIGNSAFYNCSGLTKLEISEGVTSIGDYAFYSCTSLSTISIPDSVTSIGYNAFRDCTSLTQVTIGKGVTTIGLGAFENCTAIKSITIPFVGAIKNGTSNTHFGFIFGASSHSNNNQYVPQTLRTVIITGGQEIASLAFDQCELLANVTILDQVTKLGSGAFKGCTGLISIIVPLCVEKIDASAFENCSALEKVIFAEGSKISFIGSKAFAGTKLNSAKNTIYYPGDLNEWRFVQKATDWDGGLGITYDQIEFGKDSVTVLYDMKDDKSEFYVSEFVGTSDIVVPEYYAGRPVTYVYEKSFYKNECGGATVSVTIPATVTTIESNTFYNSLGLGQLHILGSNLELSRGMIAGCDSLYALTIPFLGSHLGDTENNYLGYLFGAEKREENGEYLPKMLKTVTLTKETYILEEAFAGCSYLENINFLADVTYIGSRAFANCVALKEFVIPDSVTEIGEKILENCSSIKTIKIGENITSIPDLGKENPLFGIDKVTSSLERYYVSEGNKVYSTDPRGVIYQLHKTLEEPVAVIDAPAKADLTDYVLPAHIVYIAPYAFAYNASLRWIQLDRVRRIDKCAFLGTTSLVAAVFGQSNGAAPETGEETEVYKQFINSLALVESMGEQYYQFIGDQAFMGCTQLRYVNLYSDFILYIGDEAFYGCKLLEQVRLNQTLEGLGVKAFDETHLEYIEVDQENQNFKSIDGVLYRRSLENNGYILEVYPAYKTVSNNSEEEKVYQTEFTLPVGENIVAIQSYAFSNTEMLQKVDISPDCELVIGDYAFNSSNVYVVTIGENVSSIGLVRGEGEYTVFTDCAMLTEINVDRDNHYYSSSNGVLFDKLQYKLIKYPAAKPDKEYSLPTSVKNISSMAFKENPNIAIISISSYINTIGLEAFYGARNLVSIYFSHVYAPISVMENAFTTQSYVDGTSVDPNTVINYSPEYYENSANGDYGWSNYEGIYNIQECIVAPEYIPFDKTNYKAFYAVVVVDSTGKPLGNIEVALTDPNDITERIFTGYSGPSQFVSNAIVSVGTAMFYDLYGTEGMGLSIDYDHAYTLTVTDLNGKYYQYTTDTLMLDGEMCVTYVTLSMEPSVYGVDLSGSDINTETVDLNKAEYGTVQTVAKDGEDRPILTDGKLTLIDTGVSETVEIKVVAYYDSKWSLDLANTTALYQNGSVIPGCKIIETEEILANDKNSTYIIFEIPVDQLIPEVPIEARIGMLDENGSTAPNATSFLNIDVIEFTVSEDMIKLDTQSLDVDLSGAGEVLLSLIGEDGFNFNIGKNVKFSAVAEGKTVTVSLNAGYKKEKSSGKNAVESDCEKGYKKNHEPHNKNTWFFKYAYTPIYDAEAGAYKPYTVNIRFARGTESDGYLYYQTIVYDGDYAVAANEIDRYWGVVIVNCGRNEAKAKSMLIYYTYVVAANALALGEKDVEKKNRIYTEPVITFAPSQSTSHSFEVTVYGDIQFQYEKGKGLVPVSSTIKGDIKYAFKHNQQFWVWVIPVVLEITVDLEGNLVIKLKYDEGVSIEQAQLTLKAEIMAKVGIGCQVLSAGVYGKIGMLFILDFVPEVGVDTLKIYGGLYAYVTYVTIKFKKIMGIPVPIIGNETKDLPIWEGEWYIIGGAESSTESAQYYAIPTDALYLADAYGAADPIDYIENATMFVSNGKLHKLCFVNMTGEIATEIAGEYDEYNYLKLAVFEWDTVSCSWINPILLDDNGFNDFSYSLVQDGDTVSVVFTQQTERTTADSAEDSYDYVSDLAVKYIDLNDLGSEKAVSLVYDNDYYKYLPAFNIVNGVPTVAWVENADNNMFGVSPKNYIDSNGEVHVFATSANAIYKSEYINGSWTDPICVARNLSTVMDLVVTDDGRIVYIIDSNADMSDSNDRIAYSIAGGNVIPEVINIEDKCILALHSDGNNVYCYYESENGNGISYYDFASCNISYITVSGEDHISPDYELVFDEYGNISAVLYSQIKTWEEDGERLDGTAIYGIFKNEDGFGAPIEITAGQVVTENGVYISEFDAILNTDGNITLVVEYIDRTGASLGRVTDSYEIGSKIVVSDIEIDYKNYKLYLTVDNLGSAQGEVYYSIDGGNKIAITNLASGENKFIEIDLSESNLTPVISIFDDFSGTEIYRIDNIDLRHTDLRPVAKQLLLGSSNVLLVAIRNDGNIAGSGTLYVKVGNCVEEEMYFAEMVEAVRMLNSGDIVYIEIPLSGDITITENTIVTIFVAASDPSLEKGSASENNILYMTLNAFSKDVDEYGLSYSTEILTDKVVYDPKSENSTMPEIYFATSAENISNGVTVLEKITVDGNELVMGRDYTVSLDGVLATVKLTESYCTMLDSGCHIASLSIFGELFEVVIEKTRYYKIIWVVSETDVRETFVAEGKAPFFDGEPTKTASEVHYYVFKGWDADGDGIADKIKSAYSDAVYSAIWLEKESEYTVSWVMIDENGLPIVAEESYKYGAVPKYIGKMSAPMDKSFLAWDKEISPVTGNTVYVATYLDKSTSGYVIASDDVIVYAGSDFEVTIFATQLVKINETTFEIRYDTEVATLLGAELASGVTIVDAKVGSITLKFKVDGGVAEMPLIKLKMRAAKNPQNFSNEIFIASSDAQVISEFGSVKIYQTGDINLDGIISASDLTVLARHLARIEVISDTNSIKAADASMDGKISAADLTALAKYLAKIISSFEQSVT